MVLRYDGDYITKQHYPQLEIDGLPFDTIGLYRCHVAPAPRHAVLLACGISSVRLPYLTSCALPMVPPLALSTLSLPPLQPEPQPKIQFPATAVHAATLLRPGPLRSLRTS